ncbi:MAG TPA: O-antigen ligase family protein [Steroidobacteraceae bacterium]
MNVPAEQVAVAPPMRRRPEPKPKTTPDWMFLLFMVAFVLEYSGLPNEYPVLRQMRLTTIISYSLLLLTLGKVGFGDLFSHRQTKFLMTFLVFTILSMLWAVVKLKAYQSIRPFVDYLIFFYLAASLVDRPRRYMVFSVVMAGLAFWLVSQNLNRLGQEVRAGSYAAPYFMGDGNDFAWGLAIMMPFCLYLFLTSKSFIIRMVGLAGLLTTLFGIMGTSSRGGSLGVGAGVLFYWWFMAKRKAVGVGIIVVGLIGVLAFAPASYLNRMGSLSNTSEDTSAQARITTWKASMKMAVDYPLGVGAGNFSSAYGRFYLGGGNLGYAQNKWFSAHSIYFRTLGEYGYLGVALLIYLIIATVVDNMKVRARILAQGDAATVPINWGNLVAMATISYAICGIFLGGLSYPHLFLLCGLTVSNKRLVGLNDAKVVKSRVRRRGAIAPTPATATHTVHERKA